MTRSVESPLLLVQFATAVPCCHSLVKNESGKEVRLPSRFAIRARLLQWRQGLAGGVRRCGGRAEWVKADHTGFIGTERALTRLTSCLRDSANGERRDDSSHSRATRRCQLVAALVACRQDWINQTCRCSSRGARIRTTQICNGGSKSSSPRGGIGYFSSDNRTHGTDRRRFIGGDAGAKQVRNCDGRDDQNNRHDDEQL